MSSQPKGYRCVYSTGPLFKANYMAFLCVCSKCLKKKLPKGKNGGKGSNSTETVCMGLSSAVERPDKQWILVLLHTSPHTTRLAVILMAKILILIGCEGIEVMSRLDIHCCNLDTSVEVSHH